jgi:hypothetical protein
MSDSVRPEVTAFHELQTLIHHLGDELAGFRRRALAAEARVRELEGKESRLANTSPRELADRCAVLEGENAVLRGRLDAASARTRQLLDRVRFIRQQTQNGSGSER